MDNNVMPQVQPNVQATGMGVPGGAASAPAGVASVPSGVAGAQNVSAPAIKNDNSSLIKTVVIVILSLVAVTFIGLFIWMMMKYNEASTDLDGQIQTAVEKAVDANTMKLETEFAEREKDPYRDFTGPADYGELSFKYPKTWSLYVASDAANGGDYRAYFNPIEVNVVSNSTINALRLAILDKAFDSVAAEYQKYAERKGSNLTVQSVTVAGTAAIRYSGTIPNTEFNGIIVIFKIRDKTAVLQTDSLNFESDFNTLLSTIRFNA